MVLRRNYFTKNLLSEHLFLFVKILKNLLKLQHPLILAFLFFNKFNYYTQIDLFLQIIYFIADLIILFNFYSNCLSFKSYI